MATYIPYDFTRSQLKSNYLYQVSQFFASDGRWAESKYTQSLQDRNQINDILYRFKYIKGEKNKDLVKETLANINKLKVKLEKDFMVKQKAIEKSISTQKDEQEELFDSIFGDASYSFNNHIQVMDNNHMIKLTKLKKYDDYFSFLSFKYSTLYETTKKKFGAPLISNVLTTKRRFKANADQPLQPYVSFGNFSGIRYVKSPIVADFFLAKPLDVDSKLCIMTDNRSGSINRETKFATEAIHIIHGGNFIDVNTKRFSKENKEIYDASILAFYKMYSNIKKISESGAPHYSIQPYIDFSEYKGLTPSHGIIYDSTIII